MLLVDFDKLPQALINIEEGLSISVTEMSIQIAKVKEFFYDCCDIDCDQKVNFVSCIVKITGAPLQDLLSSFQKVFAENQENIFKGKCGYQLRNHF